MCVGFFVQAISLVFVPRSLNRYYVNRLFHCVTSNIGAITRQVLSAARLVAL